MNICLTTAVSCTFGFGGLVSADECGGDAVARLNGRSICRSVVEQKIAFQLYRLRGNIYRLIQREADAVVETMLLEEEARHRGVSVDELLSAEVDEKVAPPSDEEIEAYLAAHPGKGDNIESRRERIRTYIHQRAFYQRKLDFIAALKQAADYEFLLAPPQMPRASVATDGQPWRGSADAPVTLVHFTDLSSKMSFEGTRQISAAMREFPEQIRWVHRNFLAGADENALFVAQVGEWTRTRDKFWDFHDAVLSYGKKVQKSDLPGILERIGLNIDDYYGEDKNGRFLLQVKDDLDAARRLGVNSESVIFVNGHYFSPTFPYRRLRDLIRADLQPKE